MTASLQPPLDRLRDLIEADLNAVSVPYATDPACASRSAHSCTAGLHRALELAEQVEREQREIAEQMPNDPPGTVY